MAWHGNANATLAWPHSLHESTGAGYDEKGSEKLALGLLHGRVRGGGSEGGVDTAHARRGSPKHLGALPDGRERELPLLQSGAGHMAAIRKNGGDDPDCTHGATLYADIRACLSGEIRAEDYVSRSGTAR